MSRRVCIVPDCPVLIPKHDTRCPAHQSQHNARRGTTTEQGYGWTHQQTRAQWQLAIDAGEPVACWRCGNTIVGSDWHLGHYDDRTLAGPECAFCNLSAAGSKGRRG